MREVPAGQTGAQVRANRTGLPKLPDVPDGGKGELVVDIPYQVPEYRLEVLGLIPQNFKTGHNEGATSFVAGNVPQRASDGSIRMQDEPQIAHVDAKPHGKWKKALVGAVAVGSAPTVTLVLVSAMGVLLTVMGAPTQHVGDMLFNGPPAGVAEANLLLTMATGSLGAALGWIHAKHDSVKLAWQDEPIIEPSLQGYSTTYPDSYRDDAVAGGLAGALLDGKDGIIPGALVGTAVAATHQEYEFQPQVETKVVGHYQVPVVQHYDDRDPLQRDTSADFFSDPMAWQAAWSRKHFLTLPF